MSSETVDLHARVKRLEALLECSNGDFCQLEQMYEKQTAQLAALAKAAEAFKDYAESGWDHFPDVGINLRAALTAVKVAK
jgi:hypothetical protein